MAGKKGKMLCRIRKAEKRKETGYRQRGAGAKRFAALLSLIVILSLWGFSGNHFSETSWGSLKTEAKTASGEESETRQPTPFSLHGALRVEGTRLVGQNGETVRLTGMSTHGINWFPEYVNEEGFKTLRDDWKTNCVRLALYTEEYNGYCSGGNREELKTLVKNGVEYAGDLGMYAVIDWHILSDQDPNVHKAEAVEFFREMSACFKDQSHVLYEICNEPNGYATWDSIKQYAREVIPVIRANDPDGVIIVGTPVWSQEIQKAAEDPLEYDNLMYALHFYAATHTDWLRERLESCVAQGLPVFVSEFGLCDASGNGANDFFQAGQWMDLLEKNQISCLCWNLANKGESSSVIVPGCGKTSGWLEEDLSEGGRWIREYFRSLEETGALP